MRSLGVRFPPSQPKHAPVAQLEEATDLKSVCYGFESHQEYQTLALVTELAYVLVLETRFCGQTRMRQIVVLRRLEGFAFALPPRVLTSST